MEKKLAPVIGHAAQRMQEWGVTHWEAEHVLNNADTDLPAKIVGARELQAQIGARRLTIVVKPIGADVYRLCTIWWEGEDKP